MKLIALAAAFLTVLFPGTVYSQYSQPQPQTLGIPSSVMRYYAASQQGTQWCWAASIQMVFRSHGVNITQRKIVGRSYGVDAYGNPPDWPGSFETITANLNNWDVDQATGAPYIVGCQFGYGPPPVAVLIGELSQGYPIILAYRSSPTSGHAVVITAIRYYETPYGPDIVSIIVRDPWPSEENIATQGRREYLARDFDDVMQGYWIVRIQR